MGLVDISIVKEELGIVGTTEDVKIQRYIDTISAKIEKITGKLEETEYTEKYAGTDTTKLLLKNKPIISITSLSVDDVELVEDDDFEILEKESAVLHKKTKWLKSSYENPINNTPKASSNQALLNIDIEYLAGYETIPLDIQDITLQEVIRRYKGVWEQGEVKSWSLAGASESYAGKEIDKESGLLKENADYLRTNYSDMVVI